MLVFATVPDRSHDSIVVCEWYELSGGAKAGTYFELRNAGTAPARMSTLQKNM
jgi:hypothetical protein